MKKLLLGLVLFVAPYTTVSAFVTVTPSTIHFGQVKINTGASQMFWLNNVGQNDVRVMGCNVYGAFQCNLNCFGVLYRGQSCVGTIEFYPRSETLEFESVSIPMDTDFANLHVQGIGVK